MRLACVLLASVAAAQTDIFRYADQIPPCGTQCILQEVPKSACRVFTNATCICTDTAFYVAAQTCVLNTCTSPLDAIQTARIEALTCERPLRDRRADLTPPLILLIIGFIAVWTRLYARWAMLGRFEGDDWMMLVCAPFYLVCLGLTKLSLLCFLLRIFPNQKFRWVTYAVMLVTALSTTVYVFLGIFQCIPVSFNWEGWKGGFGPNRCVNQNALVLSAAGFSIALDVVILVLPIPLLVGLQMSWRSKASILVMFSLGVFIVITACLRLSYIIMYSRSFNPTWDNTDVLIWSGVEVSVSMIVTSLPAIRTLLKRSIPEGWSIFLSRSGLSNRRSAKKSAGTTSGTGTGTGTHGTSRGGTLVREPTPQPPPRPATPEPLHIALVSKFNKYRSPTRPRSDAEEGLELGDRIRGDVYTEIAADEGSRADGRRRDPFTDSLLRQSSIESGIHVQTTTRIASERGRGRQYSRNRGA
ncbi:CFEM domain-containing protein [Plectosphaerella plurivora]|uniref:CFEM domain-containing protein n=1 Tax=Plectosphaerella plurivora TaxID=936078 RepID=A0A9P8V7S4_9PEZI|nr:CFEM domain-containing protein [Plectosphaerella plurivora]